MFCDLESVGFHALVDPAAAFGGVDVIDLDADGAGVDGAGFAGVFAFVLEFGRFAGTEKAEGIEVALEVSPLAVGGEDAFALGVGAVGFGDGGAGAAVGSLGFRGHRSAGTRIKDAGESRLSVEGTASKLRIPTSRKGREKRGTSVGSRVDPEDTETLRKSLNRQFKNPTLSQNARQGWGTRSGNYSYFLWLLKLNRSIRSPMAGLFNGT